MTDADQLQNTSQLDHREKNMERVMKCTIGWVVITHTLGTAAWNTNSDIVVAVELEDLTLITVTFP